MANPTALERRATPEQLIPTPEAFARLAGLEAATARVITCYVRLDVEDRVANRYRLAAREALRPIRDLPAGHTDREAVRHDLKRITDYLSDSRRLPHSPGMALFACESLDLFAMMPLPRVVRTRAVLDVRPRAAEASAVSPEFAPVLLVALDRTHTRFFRVTVRDVEELPCLTLPATRGGKFHSDRADSPGWGEHDYHNRIREERHRHAAAVSDEMTRLLALGRWLGVVLAGPDRATADQVRFLPRLLQDRVLQSVRVNPTAVSEREIRQIGLAARDAARQRRVRTLLEEYEEALGSDWAVSGAGPALRALGNGEARVLLVGAGLTGPAYRCTQSGRLTMAAADCRGEGEPALVLDVVDEAIEEAMRQRVEVVLVDEPAAAGKLDGLGAVLRFRSQRGR